MLTLVAFVAEWNGRFCDFDGAYGAQCADLANQYAKECLGAPPFAGAGAVDFWQTYNHAYYTPHANTPSNYPQPGDVVIWEQNAAAGTGPNGHVAICVNGDAASFVGFSQNWPEGSPCHEVTFGYDGVVGWLHPTKALAKQPAPPNRPAQPTHTAAEFLAASKVAAIDKLASNVPVAQAPAAWASIVDYVEAHK